MPITSFTAYPLTNYIVDVFGDWANFEELSITFSFGARFTDLQYFEDVSGDYPAPIPSNATITRFEVYVNANTELTNADLRCVLHLDGVYTAADAIVNGVSPTSDELVFDFILSGGLTDFLAANGGISALNNSTFGFALFSGGNSNSLTPDVINVFSPNLFIEYETPPGGYFSIFGLWLGGRLGAGADAPSYRPVFRVRRR